MPDSKRTALPSSSNATRPARRREVTRSPESAIWAGSLRPMARQGRWLAALACVKHAAVALSI